MRRDLLSLLMSATLCSPLSVQAKPHPIFDQRRAAMIDAVRVQASALPDLRRDPHFERALAALGAIHREDFVLGATRAFAYQLTPLTIGYAQTISDPFVVTVMTAAAAVTSGSNVLEVGTGSGYQAAVLAQIGATVHSVEIIAPLAKNAARRLKHLGFTKVAVKAGDGFAGWAEFAPYDAIIVTAGAAEIPAPLLDQLRVGGHLIMPIGPQGPLEQLIRVTKGEAGRLDRCSLGPTAFVPLTGKGQRTAAQKGLYDRTIPTCYGGVVGP